MVRKFRTLLPANSKFSSTRIAIIVPSTTDINKTIPKRVFNRRLRNTARFLTKRFGGTTRIRGTGTFVSSMKKGDIVEEKVGIVESFIPKGTFSKSDRTDVRNFLEDKKKAWGQESLAVQIESPQKKATTTHFV